MNELLQTALAAKIQKVPKAETGTQSAGADSFRKRGLEEVSMSATLTPPRLFKIHIEYDDSVAQLDDESRSHLQDKVMPTVIAEVQRIIRVCYTQ